MTDSKILFVNSKFFVHFFIIVKFINYLQVAKYEIVPDLLFRESSSAHCSRTVIKIHKKQNKCTETKVDFNQI